MNWTWDESYRAWKELDAKYCSQCDEIISKPSHKINCIQTDYGLVEVCDRCYDAWCLWEQFKHPIPAKE